MHNNSIHWNLQARDMLTVTAPVDVVVASVGSVLLIFPVDCMITGLILTQ